MIMIIRGIGRLRLAIQPLRRMLVESLRFEDLRGFDDTIVISLTLIRINGCWLQDLP